MAEPLPEKTLKAKKRKLPGEDTIFLPMLFKPRESFLVMVAPCSLLQPICIFAWPALRGTAWIIRDFRLRVSGACFVVCLAAQLGVAISGTQPVANIL